MEQQEIRELLSIAKTAAIEAGKAIMEVYAQTDMFVEVKADSSPLTLADSKGNDVISQILAGTNLPILSEEGKSIAFEDRKNWEYFWLVDPLDGTKEFIKRNGEFTVNIALIHKDTPIAGVVFAPVLEKCYFGGVGLGAFLQHENGDITAMQINSATLDMPNLRVVASRSHMSPETEAFVKQITNPSFVSMGSSLKFMVLAEGNADVYPRFAPTMEWDTAAAHAVVKAAGGEIWQYPDFTVPLVYNKKNLLNPWFLAI